MFAEIGERRGDDADEAAAVVVPAVPAEAAPGEFDDEADPAFGTAIERDDGAAVSDGVRGVKIDAVGGEVLADDDEVFLDDGTAIGGERRGWTRRRRCGG